MGIVQDLRVAARRWVEVRGQPSASAAGARQRDDLRRWFVAFHNASHSAQVRNAHIFDLEASQLPWLDTGLDLEAGEWVSTFAAGRVVLSDPLDIWVGPQFQLWMRVGERGTIFNGSGDSDSFRVESTGRLYLANYFPGQWGDPQGRVSTSLRDYRKFRGGITVVVVRWRGEADAALAALAEPDGHGRVADELRRLHEQAPAPNGWDYLWFLGRSKIFRTVNEAGHSCIACDTERSVGILQHPAVFDLKPGTVLRWRWRVDELPSVLPENSALSHDYLSIAIEFENGRDITYTWSPELAVGTGYWCPLPTWKDREFHVVVRSGRQGLGTWLDERRDLYADYRHYMGQPPRRIVRVWLIAVSLFQRRRGRALLTDIALESSGDGRRLDLH